MIDPNNITTVRLGQLPASALNLTDNIPHEVGTTLNRATIQNLVDFVSNAIGATDAVGFLPITVTDGQQLPKLPINPSFFFVGPGNYGNVNGYADINCTEELNVIMSLSDRWAVAVEIPIVVNTDVSSLQQVTESGSVTTLPITANSFVKSGGNNTQLLLANGTVLNLNTLLPYTGAITDLNLGSNDLLLRKLFLFDEVNTNYGSVHYTDGNFHIEDTDGHKLFVIEDGFLQLHLSDTIQSNLYTTLLTQTRDHYLPDASGTIALLNSPTFTGTVGGITKSMVGLGNVDNTSDANKPVSTAQQTALNLKQNSLGYTPFRFINTTKSAASNSTGETRMIQVTIPANSFASSNKFAFKMAISKTGVLNTSIIRVKLSTSSSMPSGATNQIAIFSPTLTTIYAPIERTMAINGGNLKGYSFSTSSTTDSGSSTTAVYQEVAFDVTQTQYLYVSITVTATTDTSFLEYIELTN